MEFSVFQCCVITTEPQRIVCELIPFYANVTRNPNQPDIQTFLLYGCYEVVDLSNQNVLSRGGSDCTKRAQGVCTYYWWFGMLCADMFQGMGYSIRLSWKYCRYVRKPYFYRSRTSDYCIYPAPPLHAHHGNSIKAFVGAKTLSDGFKRLLQNLGRCLFFLIF